MLKSDRNVSSLRGEGLGLEGSSGPEWVNLRFLMDPRTSLLPQGTQLPAATLADKCSEGV